VCSVRWEAAPCGLDSAPPGAAGWRRSTPPPFRGLGNFAAQRSRGMARYPGVPTRLAVWGGQGKIAVERCRRTATRAKAPGCASERGCMDEAVFPERDSCQRRGGSSERSTRGDIEDPGVKRQREPRRLQQGAGSECVGKRDGRHGCGVGEVSCAAADDVGCFRLVRLGSKTRLRRSRRSPAAAFRRKAANDGLAS
jgi:hypothetical protein